MKKDNRALYPIDLKIEPLNDGLYGLGGNYDNWLSGLEVLSRLHRVWPVVRGFIYTLPTELGTCPYLKTKFPDLPMWKSNQETMVDVACAVIYSTLSEKVRADGNVQDMMGFGSWSPRNRAPAAGDFGIDVCILGGGLRSGSGLKARQNSQFASSFGQKYSSFSFLFHELYSSYHDLVSE